MRTYGVVNGGGWASDVVGGGSVTNYIAIEQSYCPLHISLFLSVCLSLFLLLLLLFIYVLFLLKRKREKCVFLALLALRLSK